MTAPARIKRDDTDRVFKSLKAAGYERARVILHLEKKEIEIIIGESGDPPVDLSQWTDDDV